MLSLFSRDHRDDPKIRSLNGGSSGCIEFGVPKSGVLLSKSPGESGHRVGSTFQILPGVWVQSCRHLQRALLGRSWDLVGKVPSKVP